MLTSYEGIWGPFTGIISAWPRGIRDTLAGYEGEAGQGPLKQLLHVLAMPTPRDGRAHLQLTVTEVTARCDALS